MELNDDSNIPANPGDDVEAIGWGFTIPAPIGPAGTPNRPQTVTYEYVPNDQCEIDSATISANQMCAYGEIELLDKPDEKVGICNGDSGKSAFLHPLFIPPFWNSYLSMCIYHEQNRRSTSSRQA